MSHFQVREYDRLAEDGNGNIISAGREPAVATQTITTSGTSQASSTFNARTRFLFIESDGIVNWDVGTSPTAVVGGAGKMPANSARFVGIMPNASLKIAVINDT